MIYFKSIIIFGLLLVSSARADKREADSDKDKRQIDRDTVVIGGSRNFNSEHGSHVSHQDSEPANYVTPRNGKVQNFRGLQQQQINELPPEYLNLLKEISYQQQFQPRFRQQQEQLKTRRPQHVSQPRPELQYVSSQPNIQQEENVQYINEEEYAKLLEQQNIRNEQVQQQQQQAAHQGQSERLGNYQSQLQKASNFRFQQQRPLPDFDKELAQLVESNKPINSVQQISQPHLSQLYSQAQQQLQQRNKHQKLHEQRFITVNVDPNKTQSQDHTEHKDKYVTPANIHFSQKGQAHQNTQHVETPGQKYQFVENPENAAQIQYYFPREKEVYQQQPSYPEPNIQQSVLYDTQGVMKVVEAPQLQHHQPESHKQSGQKYKNTKPSDEPVQSRPVPGRQGAIYVSKTTQGPPLPKNDNPSLPPLQLKNDRPLTQAEFQALVDQGYNVVPIPVPVPYVVPYPGQQQQKPESEVESEPAKHGVNPKNSRHNQQTYRYAQQANASTPKRVITYLQPVLQDSLYTGIRGPNKASQ